MAIQQVRLDLYPARVTDPRGAVHDPVKLLIGKEQVWVYRINGRDGQLLAEYGLDDARGSLRDGFVLDTPSGTIRVSRSAGCGCGSNRSWRPWPYQVVSARFPPLRAGDRPTGQ